MSFKDAAYKVLAEAGEPLHYEEITRRALAHDLLDTEGKTPDATMGAQLAVAVKRKGEESRFVRVKPAVYGLRSWVEAGKVTPEDPGPHNVRVHAFPNYQEVRAFLPAVEGMNRTAITGLYSAITRLSGTPQSNLDWTDPDTWIQERLGDEHRETARSIWQGTERTVNPRHMLGHWQVVTGYGLLEERAGGALTISPCGEEFRRDLGGRVEREIDEAEGLLKVLSVVAEQGPAKSGELMEPWMEYLARESRVRSESAARQCLYHRLKNLKDRRLIERPGLAYNVTGLGLEYLSGAGYEDGDAGGRDAPDLWQLIKHQQGRVRESIAGLLSEMDPTAFEHLVKELLEKMGYEDVEVTAPANDGGVDVVGRIQMGITSVREVVQVKRHKKNMHRPVLDQLRGSLYRFNAVRGTIITTSGFAKGLEETAIERGAPPVTLINGEKLIDLMIEHGIGVRKRKLELPEVDEDAFVTGDDEEV